MKKQEEKKGNKATQSNENVLNESCYRVIDNTDCCNSVCVN